LNECESEEKSALNFEEYKNVFVCTVKNVKKFILLIMRLGGKQAVFEDCCTLFLIRP